MKEVVDYFYAVFFSGEEEGIEARKIVEAASAIHQWPPHNFAGCEKTCFTQSPVVCVNLEIVLSSSYLVDPFAVTVITGCAFKAALNKALKHVENCDWQTPAITSCRFSVS